MMLFGKSFAKRLAGTSFLQSNCQSKIHLRIFQSEQAIVVKVQSEQATGMAIQSERATVVAIQSKIHLRIFQSELAFLRSFKVK